MNHFVAHFYTQSRFSSSRERERKVQFGPYVYKKFSVVGIAKNSSFEQNRALMKTFENKEHTPSNKQFVNLWFTFLDNKIYAEMW